MKFNASLGDGKQNNFAVTHIEGKDIYLEKVYSLEGQTLDETSKKLTP